MPDDQMLPEGLAPDEREELLAMAGRLEDERPVPRPAFRGELGRRLRVGRREEPGRIKLLITAYAGSGLALLALAAIGVAGGGPLAA